MGLDLVRVERVDPWQTPSGVMAYTVTGVTVEDQPRTTGKRRSAHRPPSAASSCGSDRKTLGLASRTS